VNETWPVAVLGATGYVAGELLRLVAQHPHLDLAAAISESQAGETIAGTFGHLAPLYRDARFTAAEDLPALLEVVPRMAVFCAAPHGAAAAMVDGLLATAARVDTEVHLVDVSADYRFADAADYAAVYGHGHGAPHRLGEFACGLPEHVAGVPARHIGHPGCFATAMLLAAVPLVKLGLVEDDLFVAAVTGSTGSGRKPLATTHHPVRHSNFYAYNPLAHRHAPEVMNLVEQATGQRPRLHFVPHSGPFARGIQATLQARLKMPLHAGELHAMLEDFYAKAPFVSVVAGTPRLKDVVGSNYAQLGVACDGESVAVFSVIDNLLKGAAGGAVQWLNRLLGWPETTGLTAPGTGWI
jgi:N-acetyl-gamma-glutamyl-phosphate reductase